jgi:hypothetical protein
MSATALKRDPPVGQMDTAEPQKRSGGAKNYKGFVAGVFSGIAKLSGT